MSLIGPKLLPRARSLNTVVGIVERKPGASSGPRAELSATSYLVLGMVRLGARYGYAIKKIADSSTQAFWSVSLAQVYPELNRLERARLLTRRSNPQGARGRSAYSITEKGEAALRAWLRSAHVSPMAIRDEGLLRLFFADALPKDDQLHLIQRVRDRARDKSAPKAFPVSAGADSYQKNFPALVASFCAEDYAFSERWFARLHVELTADRRPDEHQQREAADQSLAGVPPEASNFRWTASTPYFSPDPISQSGEVGVSQSAVQTAASSPDSTLVARSNAPIHLTPTSCLILGMVSIGFPYGYAIKRAADLSTQTFWPTSFGQLYPELARLERGGLLRARPDPQGGRERSRYSLTVAGEAALRSWLRSTRMAPMQFRNEWLLRLFFADALPSKDQLQLVRRFHQRYSKLQAKIEVYILPALEAAKRPGSPRYPATVARFGVDSVIRDVRWLAQLEAQLERGGPPA